MKLCFLVYEILRPPRRRSTAHFPSVNLAQPLNLLVVLIVLHHISVVRSLNCRYIALAGSVSSILHSITFFLYRTIARFEALSSSYS